MKVLINAVGAKYCARGGGVAEGTSRGGKAKKMIAAATRVEKAGGEVHYYLFLFFFALYAPVLKKGSIRAGEVFKF